MNRRSFLRSTLAAISAAILTRLPSAKAEACSVKITGKLEGGAKYAGRLVDSKGVPLVVNGGGSPLKADSCISRGVHALDVPMGRCVGGKHKWRTMTYRGEIVTSISAEWDGPEPPMIVYDAETSRFIEKIPDVLATLDLPLG